MPLIPMEHGLFLAAGLFVLGLVGVMVRRNIIFVIMSLEIMIHAAGLAFVVAAARWQQADGQVMFVFVLAVAAAEAAVALALLLRIHGSSKSLDTDMVGRMKG